MPITLACANPACNKPLAVPDAVIGKLMKCPLCGHVQTAVAPAQVSAPPAPRPSPPAAPPPPPPMQEELVLLPDEPPRPRRREELPVRDRHRPRRLECPWCQAPVYPEDARCPECDRLLDVDGD